MTPKFSAGISKRRRRLKETSPYGLHKLAIQSLLKLLNTPELKINLCECEKMDKLHFNINEDSLYSPILPDVVDLSSGSEDAFSIQPGDRVQLEERFRINPAGSNLMSAFVVAATASVFPNTDTTLEQDAVSEASGTQLEKDLMGLIGDLQQEQENSPTSFIDSEFEEGNLFPRTIGNDPDARTNSYGRPTARIPPTPRTSSNDRGILPRPTPVYPPNHRPELGNFQQPQANEPMEQGV